MLGTGEVYQIRNKHTKLFLTKTGKYSKNGRAFSNMGDVKRSLAFRKRLNLDDWEVVTYVEDSSVDAVNVF